jgi:hypothetical protein
VTVAVAVAVHPTTATPTAIVSRTIIKYGRQHDIATLLPLEVLLTVVSRLLTSLFQ